MTGSSTRAASASDRDVAQILDLDPRAFHREQREQPSRRRGAARALMLMVVFVGGAGWLETAGDAPQGRGAPAGRETGLSVGLGDQAADTGEGERVRARRAPITSVQAVPGGAGAVLAGAPNVETVGAAVVGAEPQRTRRRAGARRRGGERGGRRPHLQRLLRPASARAPRVRRRASWGFEGPHSFVGRSSVYRKDGRPFRR